MLTIQYKKIDELIPYARNSRTHSDAQVAQIAGSIKEFGWRVPVLIDGENGIIAGHGRVLAAYKLGITDIPTIDGSDMTEIQKRLYVIADNKIALNAGWDEEILMMEVKDLQDLGADIELLAFDPSELSINTIDYSILDDKDDLNSQIEDMANGVRKAIQIEFEPDHYQEAQELVKYWRDSGAYIGYMIMTFLKQEKEKSN
tara:strand:- start:1902 stop:2504 length:603 start_codon:yes stop_codon:yes gene_type:complete